MKIYFLLSHLTRTDYDYCITKIQLINDISDVDDILEKYVHKIGEDNSGRSQRASFIEALCFIKHYISTTNGSIGDIEWIYKQNFLIFNSEVYKASQSGWFKINQAIFVTTRDSLKHPFFHFISSGKVNSNISVIKPNYDGTWSLLDKIYFIGKIWENRISYIGNIVIPLVMDARDNSIYDILSFVGENIGERIIIKNNFGVEGQQVRALNLKKLQDLNIGELADDFFGGKIYNNRSPYFTEYYDIKEEYRFYFTYFNETVKIFSIKNKYNDTKTSEDIFSSKDFSKTNINIEWKYCSVNLLKDIRYKNITDVYHDIIPKLGLEMGVLEICETMNGDIRFIEVNPMGGPLMFSGEDENNIHRYYADMWKNIMKN